jgi:hypothetical protein
LRHKYAEESRTCAKICALELSLLAGLWADDLLTTYAQGIAACQDLYFRGSPHQLEAILPLYCSQTVLLARQPSPLQQSAAKLASQALRLACELATDREDFGAAQRAGQQAFLYAELASDSNLQVASLISLANLGFHRKLSTSALRAYEHAVSLLDENVTPLLKGRTYAGIAEMYAMRGQLQETMQAMGLAWVYEIVVDGTAILKRQSWTHLTALRQFAGSRMMVWMRAGCPHPHHHPHPSEPPPVAR